MLQISHMFSSASLLSCDAMFFTVGSLKKRAIMPFGIFSCYFHNSVIIFINSVFRDSEKQREIATLEAQVYRFTELLSEQRAATKENVTRKQARTGEERDESDDEGGAADSDEDDDDVPYNPKNLPLGWDGKVI